MKRLSLSLMLMNVFAGILAGLMVLVAVLLGVLIIANTARGETAETTTLAITALCFLIGAVGFYTLKRWAQRIAARPNTG